MSAILQQQMRSDELVGETASASQNHETTKDVTVAAPP